MPAMHKLPALHRRRKRAGSIARRLQVQHDTAHAASARAGGGGSSSGRRLGGALVAGRGLLVCRCLNLSIGITIPIVFKHVSSHSSLRFFKRVGNGKRCFIAIRDSDLPVFPHRTIGRSRRQRHKKVGAQGGSLRFVPRHSIAERSVRKLTDIEDTGPLQ